ncbi:hypothetical protein TSUD_222440 [Trifolium subterraneum]|uniref:Uncharacterized protein n=1 Tax=Trifolium subterraneum TaxID=3900 RepID=A0A2Z6M1V1_TRISU|nr:hypothetical protein TSUD_222440 [Trifolium subterraneum]
MVIVEVQVMKLHCVSRAASIMPISVDNAAQREVEMEMKMAIEAGKLTVRANYGTLLNSKLFDLGAKANEGILCIQNHVQQELGQKRDWEASEVKSWNSNLTLTFPIS